MRVFSPMENLYYLEFIFRNWFRSYSCLFCIRKFNNHDVVLLCGSDGLYPRL